MDNEPSNNSPEVSPAEPMDVQPDEVLDPGSELQARLEKLHEDKEDLQQRLLRKAADFENYRKRTMREREDLLPAIDTLKLGLQAAENHTEAKDITQGFTLVLEQFKNILGQRGLAESDPVGDPFDPKLHESVAQLASDDFAEGHILETVRIGYSFKEKLLRPASVVVSTGPMGQEEDAPSGAEG
jgi:molecular chaperone GrpE